MASSIKYLILLFVWFLPSISFAEYIQSFDSAIAIQRDSSFEVTETIRYVFTDERHGIFRDILKEHAQDSSAWFRERFIDIELIGVRMDGADVPYTITDNKDALHVRIGDPDRTITGEHVYEIRYRVQGGLSYSQEFGVELYFDATGFAWDVGMRNVSVTLSAPQGIFTGSRACYQGRLGETRSCERMEAEGNTVRFIARSIGPSEGVTIAQGIQPGSVERVILERSNTLWFWVLGLSIWFLTLGYFVYRYRTAHKTGRPIIVQYEPYEDFKPMYTGLLFDGTLHPQDITAGIVYLAQQGFLKIQKTSGKVLFFFEVDDYAIELLRPVEQIENTFLKDVATLLFGDEAKTGAVVKLSELKHDHQKQLENQKILRQLRKDLEEDLRNSGFFQVNMANFIMPGAALFIGLVLYGAYIAFAEVGSSLAFVILFVGVSLCILGFMYRRRTRKGYEALDHLEGFRDFLSVTEKERYEFHNAPAKSPEQFMEYLPYAIAFGVEKEWAEVFKDITIPDPAWYDGGTTGTHFSPTGLTTSLGAFSTAFASSSGTSGGSSGGGSAGGGGGGGGGGSW